MTGHSFGSNLYHKKKEKSKFSTKYCGPDCQLIQYLDIWQKPRLLPPGQNHGAFHGTASSTMGPHANRAGYRSILGKEEGKIEKKFARSSLERGKSMGTYRRPLAISNSLGRRNSTFSSTTVNSSTDVAPCSFKNLMT